MPRVYTTLGERRRCEAITALFTKDEKARVFAAARRQNLPGSIFVHRIVMAQVESAA